MCGSGYFGEIASVLPVRKRGERVASVACGSVTRCKGSRAPRIGAELRVNVVVTKQPASKPKEGPGFPEWEILQRNITDCRRVYKNVRTALAALPLPITGLGRLQPV